MLRCASYASCVFSTTPCSITSRRSESRRFAAEPLEYIDGGSSRRPSRPTDWRRLQWTRITRRSGAAGRSRFRACRQTVAARSRVAMQPVQIGGDGVSAAPEGVSATLTVSVAGRLYFECRRRYAKRLQHRPREREQRAVLWGRAWRELGEAWSCVSKSNYIYKLQTDKLLYAYSFCLHITLNAAYKLMHKTMNSLTVYRIFRFVFSFNCELLQSLLAYNNQV